MFFFRVSVLGDMLLRDFFNDFIRLKFDVFDFAVNFFGMRFMLVDGLDGVKFAEDGLVEGDKTLGLSL